MTKPTDATFNLPPVHETIEVGIEPFKMPPIVPMLMGHDAVIANGGEVHIYHDDGTHEIVNAGELTKQAWPNALHTVHGKRYEPKAKGKAKK